MCRNGAEVPAVNSMTPLSMTTTPSITGNTIQKEFTPSAGRETTLLDLGSIPLVNQYHKTRQEALEAERYELRAVIKEDKTIHLTVPVPPDILYGGYRYNSKVNVPYKEHCKKMFESVRHLLCSPLKPVETIIDIGGNDGTLLKAFKESSEETKVETFNIRKKPLNLINVDASDSFAEDNEAAGITYVNAFFSDELDLPKASLITSTNVFQHTEDVHKFLRGIQKFLDGVWILEFPYTLETLKTLQFDQFYHEHYYYWLATPLVSLFKQYGLKIIGSERQSIHGGSLRLWITNKTPSAPDGAAKNFVKIEEQFDYEQFNIDVQTKIQEDKKFIASLKGKTAFFGAAAKGCVYLNALGIDINQMPDSYIIDDTPNKQGYFVGGTGFKILNREHLFQDQPDNLIVLAHNFKDYITESLCPQYKGQIITMFPEITIESI